MPEEKYAGADWLKDCGKDVSIFGGKVADLLGELFGGIYHIQSEVLHKRCRWERDDYIEIVMSGHLASYDFDLLTELVILCHKYRIRVEVGGAANNYLRLVFYNSGIYTSKAHPDINDLYEKIRKS